MISVCIPVFNYDVRQLVSKLVRQAAEASFPCEIVLIDDGSDEEFRKINRSICNQQVYVELPENVGRASVRNLFLEYARFSWMLFLDCDSLIIRDDFLMNYAESVYSEDVKVVCGGRVYDKERPARDYLLRWKYGVYRESRTFEERQKESNRSFMSNNFLIRRDVLAKFPFDDRITQYGHEDTLLGFVLKENGIQINHIDNPVLNGELEINSEYLRKSALSIKNLSVILGYVDYHPGFIGDIGLLQFYKRIKYWRFVFSGLFFLFKPMIEFLLTRGIVALWMFDFYKLGLFLRSDFQEERL